jgi:hypothetical protein
VGRESSLSPPTVHRAPGERKSYSLPRGLGLLFLVFDIRKDVTIEKEILFQNSA